MILYINLYDQTGKIDAAILTMPGIINNAEAGKRYRIRKQESF